MSRVICSTPEVHDSEAMRYLYQRMQATITKEEVLIIHRMIKQWRGIEGQSNEISNSND